MPPFGGGLMQLVSYGAQDLYLTANPGVTFFKTVYQEHTNQFVSSVNNAFGPNDFVSMDKQSDDVEFVDYEKTDRLDNHGSSACLEELIDDAETDDQLSDENVLNDENIVLEVTI